MNPNFGLGRLPPVVDPRVPHMSSFVALTGALPAPPPNSPNYEATLGTAPIGAMSNGPLSSCNCAAYYHAIQTWTANAKGYVETEADANVIQLYSETSGYVPGQPATDHGGVLSHVLDYGMKTGIPLATGAKQYRHKSLGYVALDYRNTDDLKRAIITCGGIFLGMLIPRAVFKSPVPYRWDIVAGMDTRIVGGHTVYVWGYNANEVGIITWGVNVHVTWAFLAKYAEEAFCVADPDWIKATGLTPGGLTLQQLEDQLRALKQGHAP